MNTLHGVRTRSSGCHDNGHPIAASITLPQMSLGPLLTTAKTHRTQNAHLKVGSFS